MKEVFLFSFFVKARLASYFAGSRFFPFLSGQATYELALVFPTTKSELAKMYYYLSLVCPWLGIYLWFCPTYGHHSCTSMKWCPLKARDASLSSDGFYWRYSLYACLTASYVYMQARGNDLRTISSLPPIHPAGTGISMLLRISGIAVSTTQRYCWTTFWIRLHFVQNDNGCCCNTFVQWLLFSAIPKTIHKICFGLLFRIYSNGSVWNFWISACILFAPGGKMVDSWSNFLPIDGYLSDRYRLVHTRSRLDSWLPYVRRHRLSEKVMQVYA